MVLNDLFLAPVYLLILYVIAIRIRNKYLKGTPHEKYFISGLTLKFIGAIASGLIYWYYYKTGDTIYYFRRIQVMYTLYNAVPLTWFKLLIADPQSTDPDISGYLVYLRAYDSSAYMVARIGSLLSIPARCNYTAIALLFAALSYTGMWKLYRTFTDIYPKLHRELAIACLFIPSVYFWGSGIFKDTIALAALGWLTYSCYNIFVKGKFSFKMLFIIGISFYLVFAIKAYIVLCFIPAVLFWVFFNYQARIKSGFLRIMATPLILGVTVIFAMLFLRQIGAQNAYWSLNEIEDRAKDMQWWHTKVVELYGEEGGGGSAYTLGDGSFSPTNIIRSFPVAVAYTLFGPPLWRVNNVVMLLAALESMVILFITIRVFFKTGLRRLISFSISKPVIFFCLFFAVVFAFAVGFTSFNFGALVRYKIPCMPFFLAALYMLRYEANKAKNPEEFELTE